MPILFPKNILFEISASVASKIPQFKLSDLKVKPLTRCFPLYKKRTNDSSGLGAINPLIIVVAGFSPIRFKFFSITSLSLY